MSRFLTKRFSSLSPYTPGIQPPQHRQVIKLNTNENPYPPSPKVFEALCKSTVESLNLYPDPNCNDLVSAIAKHHGLSAENVCPVNGSDEALAFCFWGLMPNGAAFPDITYGFYKVYAEAYGLLYKTIPLMDDFTINPCDYKGLNETIVLANPNAPTGLYLPLRDIEALICENPNRLVIIDEAYIDFAGESAATLIPLYDNLLVIRTMSKSRSLAGARLGYALGDAALIAALNTIRFSFNPYNVNTLTMKAAIAALSDEAYFNDCLKKIITQREHTAAAMRSLGFTVTDSKTNFILAGMHPLLPAKKYYELLKEQNIIVRYFPCSKIENYVRISIGTKDQMDKLIAVTERLLEVFKNA